MPKKPIKCPHCGHEFVWQPNKIRRYPPEFITFLRQASQGEVVVPMPSIASTVRAITRLNRLRREMEMEDHPLLPLALSCEFARRPSPAEQREIRAGLREAIPPALIGRPKDMTFVRALRAAGIEAGGAVFDPSDTSPPPPEPTREVEVDPTDLALSHFLRETKDGEDGM